MTGKPVRAAIVSALLIIAIFGAGSFLYGNAAASQVSNYEQLIPDERANNLDQTQVEAESGETIPDNLIKGIVRQKIVAPWINDSGYRNWVRPPDPIVQWYKQRVTLIPGKGLFFKKTGNRLNIIYVDDNDVYHHDYWQDPSFTGATLKGDCDDCTFVCSLLLAMEYQAMVIRGYNSTTGEGHMWVKYKVSNKIYIADFYHDSPDTTNYLGFTEDYMFNNVVDRTPYDPNW